MEGMTLHALVAAAAEGGLPDWAAAGESRRAHMARVADLLGSWAEQLGLPGEERARWRSLGFLHDALREVPPEELRLRVPPPFRDLPGPVLHGPAAAERLRVAGVEDGALLRAVAYHTLGDSELGPMGRALYSADFLEPGRRFLPEWRAQLRARMPGDLDAVTREIVGARIRHMIELGSTLLPQTIAFWNRLAGERR